ncbi:hypothetical protein R3P38DRAFT_3239924 [Favolaschia claudopus]|uniref:Uncharacterized protein n=1 Tax=Favolaschia claudopus TaxID=2862362 RepID=A0AAV9Z741_9AGAR
MLPASSPDYPALARVMRVVPGSSSSTPRRQQQDEDIDDAETSRHDDPLTDAEVQAALRAVDEADEMERRGGVSGGEGQDGEGEEEGEWGFVPVRRKGAAE